MMGHYKYLFDCRNCLSRVQIGPDIYCIPGRELREHLLFDDDDRTIDCTEYRPAQLSFE